MILRHQFLFLRHGQTDWNLEGRFQGRSDIPLNSTGLEQARYAAEILANEEINMIVSSPLIRALKTAAIVAERLRRPLFIERQLSEQDFGSFDGLIVDEIKMKHGVPLREPASNILPGDAEQWRDTVARAETAVSDWIGRYTSSQILFVSHDGIFRALLEALHESRFESENGRLYRFIPQASSWIIEGIDLASALSGQPTRM